MLFIFKVLLLLLYFCLLVWFAFLIDMSSSLLAALRGSLCYSTNPLDLSVSCLKAVLVHRGIDLSGLIEADELRKLVSATGVLTMKELHIAMERDAYEVEALSSVQIYRERNRAPLKPGMGTQRASVHLNYSINDFEWQLPFKQLDAAKLDELVSARNNEAWLVQTVGHSGTFFERTAWLQTQLRLGHFAVRSGTLNCSESPTHARACSKRRMEAPGAYLLVPGSRRDADEADLSGDTLAVRIYRFSSGWNDSNAVVRWVQRMASRHVVHFGSLRDGDGVLFVFVCPLCDLDELARDNTTSSIPLVFGALPMRFAGRVRFAFVRSLDELPPDVAHHLQIQAKSQQTARYVLFEAQATRRDDAHSHADQLLRAKFLARVRLEEASFSKRMSTLIDEARTHAMFTEADSLRQLQFGLNSLLSNFDNVMADNGGRLVAEFECNDAVAYLSFNQLDAFVRALVPDANDYFVTLLIAVQLFSALCVVDCWSRSRASLVLRAFSVFLLCNLLYFVAALGLLGAARYVSAATPLVAALRRVAQSRLAAFIRFYAADSSLFTIESITVSFVLYFVAVRFALRRFTAHSEADSEDNADARASAYRSAFVRDGLSLQRATGHEAVVLFDYPLLADQRRLTEYLSKLRVSFFNEPTTQSRSRSRSRSPSPPTSNSEEERDADGIERPACSICIERFRRGQVLCTLPCEHRFHEMCVLEWLFRGHLECPLCRWPANKTRPKNN